MRSRNSLIWAGIVTTLLVSVTMWGCSDDAAAPTTTNVIVDEDRSIETMIDDVSEQVNSYLDSTVSVMAAGLRVATYVDVGGGDWGDLYAGGGYDVDSLDQDHSWIVAWTSDLQAGVGAMSKTDSITYVVDGVIGTITSGADEMYVRHHYTFVSSDTTTTFADVGNHCNLHITGIDGTTATINGTVNATVYDKAVTGTSTTWNIWDIEVTLDDVDVTKTSTAWTNGCPNSGSCTVAVEYTYAEDTDVPMTTSWLYDVTFTDGTMAADVTIGNLNASYENDLCTIQ